MFSDRYTTFYTGLQETNERIGHEAENSTTGEQQFYFKHDANTN